MLKVLFLFAIMFVGISNFDYKESNIVTECGEC